MHSSSAIIPVVTIQRAECGLFSTGPIAIADSRLPTTSVHRSISGILRERSRSQDQKQDLPALS
ncbi:MAG: hypothetical protein ACFB4J_19620 [Elainellaceae cyanobacterium]